MAGAARRPPRLAGTDTIPVLEAEDGSLYRGTREIFAHLASATRGSSRWRNSNLAQPCRNPHSSTVANAVDAPECRARVVSVWSRKVTARRTRTMDDDARDKLIDL